MALDQVEVMRALGSERFAVVGHDRGGRVAVAHVRRASRSRDAAAILDIVPLPYSMVTREFATQYFRWFFLIQPAPFPETLIGNNASSTCDRAPATDRRHGRGHRQAFAEYCVLRRPRRRSTPCAEDYRAGATFDLDHSHAGWSQQ